MQFSEFDLDNKLLDAINKMGYETPTSIQQQAIPEALQGRDILASAPTGTGKTAAFLIPAIQYLLDFPRRDPGFARVLVMTPTRELAYQIHEQCELLAKRTHLKIGVVTGGINYGTHKEIFEKNNDILIATPGRLMEYLETENFHVTVTHLDNFIHNNFFLFLIRCGGMVDKLRFVRFSQIINIHFVSLQHYLSNAA